jgi:hypothetical protein
MTHDITHAREAAVCADPPLSQTLSAMYDALGFQTHPFDVSQDFEPWPEGEPEPVYYKPFAWLLNSILALAKEHRASSGEMRRLPGKKAMQGKQEQGDFATLYAVPLHRDLQF